MTVASPASAPSGPGSTALADGLQRELWTSFVSVLRSYLAAHTLNRGEQAILEVGAESLLVRIGTRSLRIEYPAQAATAMCHPERSGPAVSAHAAEGPASATACHPERAERVEGTASATACHPERAERVEGPAFPSIRGGTWQRENTAPTPFRFDDHGRIITGDRTEEMDIIAEQLAREITTL